MGNNVSWVSLAVLFMTLLLTSQGRVPFGDLPSTNWLARLLSSDRNPYLEVRP